MWTAGIPPPHRGNVIPGDCRRHDGLGLLADACPIAVNSLRGLTLLLLSTAPSNPPFTMTELG